MSTDVTLKHYLYPSAIFADSRHHHIDTILGSCVAVCLHDVRLKKGGINHYMLPFWNGEGLATPKYGNIAIHKLYERMIMMGSKKQDLIAKVFGGANQINTTINIGERNIIIALDTLQELGIPIVARNTGGNIGRKIKFDSYSGEVFMKLLSR
jgi:chemotaxis protein CheD